MMKIHYKKLFICAVTVVGCQIAYPVYSQDPSMELEEVVVTGIRQSIQQATDIKKNAEQIVDAITAEDIGKLPDNNVAEAMQRVTGIQIDRDEIGDGSTFQVRGMSQNSVEINGQTVASNSEGNNRQVSFDAVPSALFKSIEVIKTPTADMIEGALGATVRLNTFKPLEFKKPTTNLSVEASDNENAEDTGYNAKALYGANYDLGNMGRLGFLVNVNAAKDYQNSSVFAHDWRLAHTPTTNRKNMIVGENRNNPAKASNVLNDGDPFPTDYAIWMPRTTDFEVKDWESDSEAIDLNLQWEFFEDLTLELQATQSSKETFRTQSRLRYDVNSKDARLQLDPATYTLHTFERPIPDGFTFYTDNAGTPYVGGTVSRGIVSAGTVEIRNGKNTPLSLVNNQFQNTEIDTGTYAFTADWQASDALRLTGSVAFSSSDKLRQTTFTNMQLRTLLDSAPGSVPAGDIVIPNIVFDHDVGTDLPTFKTDFTGVNTARGLSGENQLNLASREGYHWNNLGAFDDEFKNDIEALQLDVDWDINMGGFTTLEFGTRISSNNRVRKPQYKIASLSGASDEANFFDSKNVNFNTDSNITANNISLDELADQAPGYEDLINQAFFFGGAAPRDFGFSDFSGDINRTWVTPNSTSRDLFFRMMDEFLVPAAHVCVDPNDNSTIVDCVRDDLNLVVNSQNVYSYDGEVHPNVPNRNFSFRENPKVTQYDIEEKTTALYAKANFEGELWDLPFFGNVGLRWVNTKVEGSYKQRLKEFDGQPPEEQYKTLTNDDTDYNNLLPSGNITFQIQDKMFLRFAMARNIKRPGPESLMPTVDFNSVDALFGNATEVRVRLGNPDLKPMISDQLDISWEYYASEVTHYSAAFFYKELDDFIETRRFGLDTDSIPGIELPDTVDTVNARQEQNTVDGFSRGIELSATTAFDFLPAPFDGFGIIANYTYVDSERESSNNVDSLDILDELTNEVLPLPNLSETSYNLILFWEKYGWSARAAYNWRDVSFSDFTIEASNDDPNLWIASVNESDPSTVTYIRHTPNLAIWNDDYGQLDLSLSYQFANARVSLNVRDALSDPQRRYVTNNPNYLTRWAYSGTTYRLGVRYKF